jgi:mono/diheme cytochrome c family protein
LATRSYREQCAGCHGVDGTGDGPAARWLDPPPADFRRGQFMLATTASGHRATHDDIARAIAHGMPGTSMEAFDKLTTAERQALAHLVRWLAMRGRLQHLLQVQFAHAPFDLERARREAEIVQQEFDSEHAVVATPPAPADRNHAAAMGARLWSAEPTLCATCHGDHGQGDGPQAALLEDGHGRKAPPRDLRLGWFKGGDRPRDLFLRIKCGLRGTPMPAFGGQLSDEQIWNLAFHVWNLANLPQRP